MVVARGTYFATKKGGPNAIYFAVNRVVLETLRLALPRVPVLGLSPQPRISSRERILHGAPQLGSV